ncbi:MAG: hypothetical protein AOA66_0752 [Candidatus Bathyarchaeota archaeon BA2]|nr:MAG: hypothetical protein AOA66_0752 [Candidatus Bathyarchaeota archaeon BA2]
MQVWKKVTLRLNGKPSDVRALFDSGSSFTVMGYGAVNELFGEVQVERLVKTREVVLANGQKIVIDGYVDSQIVIDGYMIEERVYLSKDIVRKAVVEGREALLPDIIIGSPTMETWGIELDLKKGDVVIRGASFLL